MPNPKQTNFYTCVGMDFEKNIFTAGRHVNSKVALCKPIVEEWRSFLKIQFNTFYH